MNEMSRHLRIYFFHHRFTYISMYDGSLLLGLQERLHKQNKRNCFFAALIFITWTSSHKMVAYSRFFPTSVMHNFFKTYESLTSLAHVSLYSPFRRKVFQDLVYYPVVKPTHWNNQLYPASSCWSCSSSILVECIFLNLI